MSKKIIEQTREDCELGYEGLQVKCPFCVDYDANGTLDWEPSPFISRGSCHNCGREFEVIIRWEAGEDK